MERVAIISNGPSAHLFDEYGDLGYDATIGVGKVAGQRAVDWWCFRDAKTFERVLPIGHPNLFVSPKVESRLRARHDHTAYDRFVAYQGRKALHTAVQLPELRCGRPWNLYSGVAAMGLPIHLGARAVYVFGADMEGDTDCKGERNGHNRNETRWGIERAIWSEIVEILRGRGIDVLRVTAETTRGGG